MKYELRLFPSVHFSRSRTRKQNKDTAKQRKSYACFKTKGKQPKTILSWQMKTGAFLWHNLTLKKKKDDASVTELKLVKRRLASFHFSCFFDKPNEFQDNDSCYAGRYIFCGSYD